MKLIELMAVEVKAWPKGGYLAYQSSDARVFWVDGIAEFDNGGWHYSSERFSIDGPRLSDRADDHQYAFVIESEWQEARTAVVREQEICLMVGECPYPGSASTRIDCERLYDLGYRKP